MIFARRRSSCALSPLSGAEHLQRGPIVDVFAAPERVDERLLLGQVREHPQFDLGIVGGNQHASGIGNERAPDLAAEIGADRNVLQVGIAAAETPRGGDRLVEGRVHPRRPRVHQLRAARRCRCPSISAARAIRESTSAARA